MALNDKMKEYKNRINQIQGELTTEKEQYLKRLLSQYEMIRQSDLERLQISSSGSQEPGFIPHNAVAKEFRQIDLTTSNDLNRIDREFTKLFNQDSCFPEGFFSYPIVFCETLEEFYSNVYQNEKLSATNRADLIRSAVKYAEHGNECVYGVNLPGSGCYINGWVFGKKYNLDPRVVLNHPVIFMDIARTAIHEKLGHGFLKLASQIGRTVNSLGFQLIEIANRFSKETYTDIMDSVRYEQHKVLFTSSTFLEEGWSTWIESFLSHHLYGSTHPRYTLEQWNAAIDKGGIRRFFPTIQQEIKDQSEVLLKTGGTESEETGERNSRKTINPSAIHNAMTFFCEKESQIQSHLKTNLGQPLRYVFGQLLMSQVEEKCGALCVPHAAVIAGNIKFDLESLGVADLAKLVSTDPMANANTRLAMISQIEIPKKNDIPAFARLIEEELNIPVPDIYKQR